MAYDPDETALSAGAVKSLLETSQEIVGLVAERTTVFDTRRERLYPRFFQNELVVGRVLGRGGFCVVNEIKSFKLSKKVPSTVTVGSGQNSSELSVRDNTYTREDMEKRSSSGSQYCIKRLSAECYHNPDRFLKGTIDLAIEMKFLSVLDHPNIIAMRAMSNVGPFQEGFFIVLDRLNDTLGQQMRKWKKSKGGLRALARSKSKKKELELNRIKLAREIAMALQYLHCNRIIYRDLKPENMGFDFEGNIKIIDFGLAKYLADDDMLPDGTYNLTKFTGSLRYMAPEVAITGNHGYSTSADVYSFGILLWQMLSLEEPFATYTCKMHNELVVHQGYRPAIDKNWDQGLGDLLKSCWSPRPSDRPEFEEIVPVLSEMYGLGGKDSAPCEATAASSTCSSEHRSRVKRSSSLPSMPSSQKQLGRY